MDHLSEEFQRILEKYRQQIQPVKVRRLPEIDLYMDQVTTFMEEKLKNLRRNPEEKILTKTMINNYTKNHLFPPPVKKKYSQDHLIMLLYTYYLKHTLSIGDITTLLEPMTQRYWGKFRNDQEGDVPANDTEVTMRKIYDDTFSNLSDAFQDFQADIQREMERAADTFKDPNLSQEERDYLQKFMLISMLGIDVYMKKRLMELIIDDMKEEQ